MSQPRPDPGPDDRPLSDPLDRVLVRDPRIAGHIVELAVRAGDVEIVERALAVCGADVLAPHCGGAVLSWLGSTDAARRGAARAWMRAQSVSPNRALGPVAASTAGLRWLFDPKNDATEACRGLEALLALRASPFVPEARADSGVQSAFQGLIDHLEAAIVSSEALDIEPEPIASLVRAGRRMLACRPSQTVFFDGVSLLNANNRFTSAASPAPETPMALAFEALLGALDPAAPAIQRSIDAFIDQGMSLSYKQTIGRGNGLSDGELAVMASGLMSTDQIRRFWIQPGSRQRPLPGPANGSPTWQSPAQLSLERDVVGMWEGRDTHPNAPRVLSVRRGDTPARTALLVRVFERLRAAGFDLNDPATCALERHAPLHLAAGYGDAAVVGALLACGADPDLRIGDTPTPAELIAEAGLSEAARVLTVERARRAGAALRAELPERRRRAQSGRAA